METGEQLILNEIRGEFDHGNHNNSQKITFIDLFAGIGGIRKGLELACKDLGIYSECVFTSEIKPYAISVIKQNHPYEQIHGDITDIDEADIPDFDILLAGFPCQPFSFAGKRRGFDDIRGTLFFDVARILKCKKPKGFILENVEGLVNHDKANPKDKTGRTLRTILKTLEELDYKVSWKVLNAKYFSVPQERKRVYIVGTREVAPSLDDFPTQESKLSDILESGLPAASSPFIDLVLKHYKPKDLYGKSFKDKRGGSDNIHSWDIDLKGKVTAEEKNLLGLILTERRKRKWADAYGIDWMDGMPLTFEHIQSFYPKPNVKELLDGLVDKGYLKMERPKRIVDNKRVQDGTLPLGYNIVTGKMSFEVNKVLDPKGIAPTLVAMDMQRLYVVDGEGLRKLSLREGLRLFGYPEDFRFHVNDELGYDLLGNTVVVSVIRAVARRMLYSIK